MLYCDVTVNKSQTCLLEKMFVVLREFYRNLSYTHIWNCKVANLMPETLSVSEIYSYMKRRLLLYKQNKEYSCLLSIVNYTGGTYL